MAIELPATLQRRASSQVGGRAALMQPGGGAKRILSGSELSRSLSR